jgi:hypothetical protein
MLVKRPLPSASSTIVPTGSSRYASTTDPNVFEADGICECARGCIVASERTDPPGSSGCRRRGSRDRTIRECRDGGDLAEQDLGGDPGCSAAFQKHQWFSLSNCCDREGRADEALKKVESQRLLDELQKRADEARKKLESQTLRDELQKRADEARKKLESQGGAAPAPSR